MGVAVEAAFRVAEVDVVACEVPDDEGLVAAAGEEHVWVFQARGQGGDPAAVALERAAHNQLLRHAGLVGGESVGARVSALLSVCERGVVISRCWVEIGLCEGRKSAMSFVGRSLSESFKLQVTFMI